ncbi:hypothetical protein J4407_03165 [Candidatus Pacearchaeota archaeon]|nr:hypothetical protein [Candidatus Pacearchaeota archaeon]
MPRQRRAEFIPLAYDSEGKVIDVMGYVRKVEAIPYALDVVYIPIEIDGSPFKISEEILSSFKENIPDELKEQFKKGLEGKVGFISGSNAHLVDSDGEGTWIYVQLYRVKD